MSEGGKDGCGKNEKLKGEEPKKEHGFDKQGEKLKTNKGDHKKESQSPKSKKCDSDHERKSENDKSKSETGKGKGEGKGKEKGKADESKSPQGCKDAWGKKEKLDCKEAKKGEQISSYSGGDQNERQCPKINKIDGDREKVSEDFKCPPKRDDNGCENKSTAVSKEKESLCSKSAKDKRSDSSQNEKKEKDAKARSKSTSGEKSSKGQDKRDPFGRRPCPVKEKEKEKTIDCHESRKQFFKGSKEKEDKKKSKDEDKYNESSKKEKNNDMSDSPTKKDKNQQNCGDSVKKETNEYTDTESSDSDRNERVKESAQKSKESSDRTDKCMEIADMRDEKGKFKVSPKRNFSINDGAPFKCPCEEESKRLQEGRRCRSSDDLGKPQIPLSKKTVGDLTESFTIAGPKLYVAKPTLPRVEKSKFGASLTKICRPSLPPIEVCPQLKALRSSEFFCIDARNTSLNDCLRKHMNLDPMKVTAKCSEYAKRKRMLVHEPEKLYKQGTLLPPRSRQMLGRWWPSAALYLTTTAILTVWVTEWKSILKHVPIIGKREDIPDGPTEPTIDDAGPPIDGDADAVVDDGGGAANGANHENNGGPRTAPT